MFDGLPIWILFICVLVAVFIAMEVGYAVKKRFTRDKTENEGMVSVVTGAVLGLLGFVLAFTFSLVYTRYETRKELVRQQANAVRRVWLRSELMNPADRSSTIVLLKKFLDVNLLAAQSRSAGEVNSAVEESESIQHNLWESGVAKAKTNSLSGLSPLYLQSVSDLIDLQSQRLAIGARDRVPSGIWISLGSLLILSMVNVGYFEAIKGGKHSRSNIIMAMAFSLLFVLVSALDDPFHGWFIASQQPLLNVKAQIDR
jgi:hypothetical protein